MLPSLSWGSRESRVPREGVWSSLWGLVSVRLWEMGEHSESVGSMWRKQSKMMSLPSGEQELPRDSCLRSCLPPPHCSCHMSPNPGDTSQATTCSLSLLLRIVFPSPGSPSSYFLEFPPTSVDGPFLISFAYAFPSCHLLGCPAGREHPSSRWMCVQGCNGDDCSTWTRSV